MRNTKKTEEMKKELQTVAVELDAFEFYSVWDPSRPNNSVNIFIDGKQVANNLTALGNTFDERVNNLKMLIRVALLVSAVE